MTFHRPCCGDDNPLPQAGAGSIIALMTTINDIKDLVQVLQDHPEWLHTIRGLVIGEELAQVLRRTIDLERILAAHLESNDRVIRDIREGQKRLEESQAETDRKFTAYMESNDRNMQLLRESQQETDLKLAAFIEATEKNFRSLIVHMDRIAGRMDNGFGMNYQYKVEKNIRSIAMQHLGLRRLKILRDYGIGYDPDFVELIESAWDDDAFDADEIKRLWQIDLAFFGRRQNGMTEYVAAEISIGIGQQDIVRASERANTLARLVNHSVIPLVIGDHFNDYMREFAEERGVAFIVYPDY